jgi:membrane protein CcdC involved in cytochrome C biogenesis
MMIIFQYLYMAEACFVAEIRHSKFFATHGAFLILHIMTLGSGYFVPCFLASGQVYFEAYVLWLRFSVLARISDYRSTSTFG